MALGAINHVALTVADMSAVRSFFAPILTFLGYKNTENPPRLSIWESDSTGSAINIWEADPELRGYIHKRYAPGLHHLAFNADSREQVNRFHELLQSIDATALEPPAEYSYAPGYYAVFFASPDGLKFELAHIPGPLLGA